MELGRADFRQDSNSTDPSLPLPSVRTTIGRHFKLVFFALLVVALVEGVHNLGVVTDRIGHLTGRFLFVLLHVFAAAAFTFLLVPFQIILALAWHRIRRVQFVQHAVIVGGGVGLGVSDYVFFAVRIERAVNYVMRRLFADVEYELSPTPRSFYLLGRLGPGVHCMTRMRA